MAQLPDSVARRESRGADSLASGPDGIEFEAEFIRAHMGGLGR